MDKRSLPVLLFRRSDLQSSVRGCAAEIPGPLCFLLIHWRDREITIHAAFLPLVLDREMKQSIFGKVCASRLLLGPLPARAHSIANFLFRLVPIKAREHSTNVHHYEIRIGF